ncbi:MAG TPA: sulfite exporter TauE/SafE family protein [Myxococcota bacterium]|nr:sulfite exporter TauE/SafE family protein [Myxococcota bacterium]
MVVLLALLGVFAGALTTVAGMGGGFVMVVVLSLFMSPVEALAITAPALLLANAHRAWMYRAEIAWREIKPLILGAFPFAVLGSFIATALPDAVIRLSMAAMAAMAVARVVFELTWAPSRVWNGPAGALTGFVSATTGGGGTVMGPFLLARGLSGTRYVVTGACTAGAIHIARIGSYTAAGAGVDLIVKGVLLASMLFIGNLLGDRVRRHLGESGQHRVQLGVMLACVGLALVG